MNISPVSLVNFKSTIKNTQNYKQANEVSATSPINVSVSSEALKAKYCPQISFKGKNNSDTADEMVAKAVAAFANSKLERLSPEQIHELLNSPVDDDTIVAKSLKSGNPEIYEQLLELLRNPERYTKEEVLKILEAMEYNPAAKENLDGADE